MTLTYFFSAEVTPLTKSRFFAKFSRFSHKLTKRSEKWENGLRYLNYFNGQQLGKWRVWAFQQYQNEPPTFPFILKRGLKTKKRTQLDFTLSNYITKVRNFLFNNFQQQSCLLISLEEYAKKLSKSMHNHTVYSDFSVTPQLTCTFQTAECLKWLHQFVYVINQQKGYDKSRLNFLQKVTIFKVKI